MALELTMSFEGAALVGADIMELTGRLRSFREPLKKAVQEVVIPSIQKNFEQEGRPESWEPLSDWTIYTRGLLGFPEGPILNRTGKLKRVMGQLNIWTINKDEAFIGGLPQDVSYGVVHQDGGRQEPAREFALIQEEDELPIMEIFEDHMMRGVVY